MLLDKPQFLLYRLYQAFVYIWQQTPSERSQAARSLALLEPMDNMSQGPHNTWEVGGGTGTSQHHKYIPNHVARFSNFSHFVPCRPRTLDIDDRRYKSTTVRQVLYPFLKSLDYGQNKYTASAFICPVLLTLPLLVKDRLTHVERVAIGIYEPNSHRTAAGMLKLVGR
jgi:hypothetical protein